MVVLHLTDLHASPAREADLRARWCALAEALDALPEGWRPDGAAITGDLVCTAAPAELALAERYLGALLCRLRLPAERVACCPGNHDGPADVNGGVTFSGFDALLARMGFAAGRMRAAGQSFACVNTCRRAGGAWFDRAALAAEETARPLAPGTVLLLHHPPERVADRAALERFAGDGCLLLSGHTHAPRPVLAAFGTGWSLNGCAVSPNGADEPWGCQLVRLEGGRLTAVLGLVSASQTKINIRFEEIFP